MTRSQQSRSAHLPAFPGSCAPAGGGGWPGRCAPDPQRERCGHGQGGAAPCPAATAALGAGVTRSRLAGGSTVLPAGSLRNEHSLPLLQHTGNRGTACCSSSPSSSAGSPPLGPPALIGEARAAAPRSRAGPAGPSAKAGPCLRRLSRSAPGAPDSGRYCSSCNWHKQPAIT